MVSHTGKLILNFRKIIMKSNVTRFTSPETIEMYNKAFSHYKIVLEKLEKQNAKIPKYAYFNNPSQRDIANVNELHTAYFYIPELLQIKKFILNSSLVYYKPVIASEKRLYIELRCRLKYNVKTSVFGKVQQHIYTYSDYGLKNHANTCEPNIQSLYVDILQNYISVYASSKTSQDLETLLDIVLMSDPEVIQKTAEFNAAIKKQFDIEDQTKPELIKSFFNNRFADVSSKMKSKFKNSKIIANISSEELATLFQLISKFPSEIEKIQAINKNYSKDISYMTRKDIIDIFDEIKILLTFK